MAKVPRLTNLATVMAKVQQRVESDYPRDTIEDGEPYSIPVVSVGLQRDFSKEIGQPT